MADLPIALAEPALAARLAAALDPAGRIPRALDALAGPAGLAGSDVLLLDGGEGLLGRPLAALGAHVTLAPNPVATGLPAASVDAAIACWSAVRSPDGPEAREALRVLRPGGHLLVIHDYGRDDVARLLGTDRPEIVSWSHRKGPFLTGGFRVRVIHTRWQFPDAEACGAFIDAAFGAAARALVPERAYLEWKVAIYHRSVPASAG